MFEATKIKWETFLIQHCSKFSRNSVVLIISFESHIIIFVEMSDGDCIILSNLLAIHMDCRVTSKGHTLEDRKVNGFLTCVQLLRSILVKYLLFRAKFQDLLSIDPPRHHLLAQVCALLPWIKVYNSVKVNKLYASTTSGFWSVSRLHGNCGGASLISISHFANISANFIRFKCWKLIIKMRQVSFPI